MSEHALLSPSGAHRWMACPASAWEEGRLPDETSEYSEYGTAAHELATKCLTGVLKAPSEKLGQPMSNEVTVDAEMVRHIEGYIEYVLALKGDDSLYVEKKLDLSRWAPKSFGTADIIIPKDKELIVCDLKMGAGCEVKVLENPQLMLYALGALHEFPQRGPFERVRCIIYQPRWREDGQISEWTCDVQALLAHGRRIKAHAADAWAVLENPRPPAAVSYAPSIEACKFCRARAVCKARREHVLETVRAQFEDLPDEPAQQIQLMKRQASTLDNPALGRLLDIAPLLEDLLKDIRALALQRLQAGETLPGYRLGEGRQGNRKWISVEAVEAVRLALGLSKQDFYVSELRSPAQLQKQLKKANPDHWKALEALIERAQGKPAVVPVAGAAGVAGTTAQSFPSKTDSKTWI